MLHLRSLHYTCTNVCIVYIFARFAVQHRHAVRGSRRDSHIGPAAESFTGQATAEWHHEILGPATDQKIVRSSHRTILWVAIIVWKTNPRSTTLNDIGRAHILVIYQRYGVFLGLATDYRCHTSCIVRSYTSSSKKNHNLICRVLWLCSSDHLVPKQVTTGDQRRYNRVTSEQSLTTGTKTYKLIAWMDYGWTLETLRLCFNELSSVCDV